jgi:hypothetical protein
MHNELLEIAHHCRVMSDHTIDLSAASEFRKLAERLEKLAVDVKATIAQASVLSKNAKQ